MFANVAAHAGKLDDVIAVWSKLDRLQPQRSQPAVNLAEALMRKYVLTADTTFARRALSLFNRLESRLGPTIPVTSRKISTYFMLKDTAAIIAELDRLEEAAPADVEAHLLAGTVYQNLQMYDKALGHFNKAQSIDPEDGQVYISKAEFFRARGDSVAYDKEVFKALESQELEFEQKFELLTSYVTKLYTDTLQWPRISEMFAVLQDINPGEARLHDFYSSYNDAIGQKEQAAEQLSYSIALDPSAPERWSDLAVLYFNLDDTVKAYRTAKEARALYPENPGFYLLESTALLMQGKDIEALAVLDSIDNLQIGNPVLESNLYATRGDILSRLDRADEAQDSYKRAVEANPDNYMAMNNWAYHNAEKGVNLDAAELYAAIACAGTPDDPTVIDTYAWVLFKKKDYEKAKAEIDRAMKVLGVFPGEEGENKSKREMSAEIFDHAGDIYFWNQLPKEAIEFWKKALELEPDNELIKKKVRDGTYHFE